MSLKTELIRTMMTMLEGGDLIPPQVSSPSIQYKMMLSYMIMTKAVMIVMISNITLINQKPKRSQEVRDHQIFIKISSIDVKSLSYTMKTKINIAYLDT